MFVVQYFCGHGIGQVPHDSPNILNFGRSEVKTLAGDWTATGYPATIEGAILSGRLAAAEVVKRKAA